MPNQYKYHRSTTIHTGKQSRVDILLLFNKNSIVSFVGKKTLVEKSVCSIINTALISRAENGKNPLKVKNQPQDLWNHVQKLELYEWDGSAAIFRPPVLCRKDKSWSDCPQSHLSPLKSMTSKYSILNLLG